MESSICISEGLIRNENIYINTHTCIEKILVTLDLSISKHRNYRFRKKQRKTLPGRVHQHHSWFRLSLHYVWYLKSTEFCRIFSYNAIMQCIKSATAICLFLFLLFLSSRSWSLKQENIVKYIRNKNKCFRKLFGYKSCLNHFSLFLTVKLTANIFNIPVCIMTVLLIAH